MRLCPAMRDGRPVHLRESLGLTLIARCDLLRRVLVLKFTTESAAGSTVAMEAFYLVRRFGPGGLLVQVKHALHEFHDAIVRGLLMVQIMLLLLPTESARLAGRSKSKGWNGIRMKSRSKTKNK